MNDIDNVAADLCEPGHVLQGVLAGTELTRVRYAVVVSLENITAPDDIVEGEVPYRHINIAVSSETRLNGALEGGDHPKQSRSPQALDDLSYLSSYVGATKF
jgi:hypothetical protein